LRAAFFINVVLPAQGIEAESPQKAHRRFRGLGADSPVFSGFARKSAPKFFCLKKSTVKKMLGLFFV
jgi:hypothetical protein